MSWLAVQTALSGVQDIISGNVTYYQVSQSLPLTQPEFYFGKKFVTAHNAFPYIVWEPTHTRTVEQKGTLGKIPRPLYLEEVHITAHVIGQDPNEIHFLKENVQIALRDSQFWWGKNFYETRIINPMTSQDDFWHEELDIVLMNPIVDLLPISASVNTVNFVTASSIAVSGAIQIPSASF